MPCYYVGIIDLNIDDVIWKRFDLNEGLYLSIKSRICTWKSAVSFETKKESELFFHNWVNKDPLKFERYKFESVVYNIRENIDVELYDQTHPIWDIELKEKPHLVKAARAYFFDYLHQLQFSKQTLKKYRSVILKYGVDINYRVLPDLNLNLRSIKIREQYCKDSNSVKYDKNFLRLV